MEVPVEALQLLPTFKAVRNDFFGKMAKTGVVVSFPSPD
jgi:hypothetical protein